MTDKKKLIVAFALVVILFMILLSFTVSFNFLTPKDFMHTIILIICTSLLTLIGQKDLSNTRTLKIRIRANLFLTAFMMSSLLIYNSFAKQLILPSGFLKPIIIALMLYLPIENALSRYKNTELKPNREELTRREKEIYDLALQDLPNKVIAEKLFIAESTVKKHMNSILKKLDCVDRKMLIEKNIDQK